jgi:ABC-2 type transport system permease protein
VTGVLTIGSEYGNGLIRATLAATPQRGLMLAAKVVSFGAAAWAIGTATCLATFLLGQTLLSSPVPHAALGQPGVLRAVFGAGVYLLCSGLLGLALGALMRSTAAAIGALVVLLVVLPGIAGGLPASIKSHVMPYLPSEAGHALYVVIRDPAYELSPGGGLALLAGYVAVALVAAVVLVRRRDA